jgi:structure-specific endonuclease subunit SLX1
MACVQRAWQTSYETRHIADEDRVCRVSTVKKVSRSGKPVTKRVPPRMTLKNTLGALHVLLKSKSFARWPLSLRFFSADVYQAWNIWCDRAPADIRPGIKTVMDPLATQAVSEASRPSSQASASMTLPTPPALAAFDVTYLGMKNYLGQARSLLAEQHLNCTVCRSPIDSQQQSALVCPHGCSAVSHLTCLSTKFLEEEGAQQSVVPLQGNCPGCETSTEWSELVKELSLRTTAAPLVDMMLNGSRKRKAPGTETSGRSRAADFDEKDWFADMYGDSEDELPARLDVDDNCELEVEERDGNSTPPSGQAETSKQTTIPSTVGIILDSEWDDIEVLV